MSDHDAAPTGDLRPDEQADRAWREGMKIAAKIREEQRAARDEALASAQPAAVASDALRGAVEREMFALCEATDANFEAVKSALERLAPSFALIAPPVDAALERAAEVAESHRCAEQLIRHKMSAVDQVGVTATTIAKAIRALKSATPARPYTEADMAAARAEERRFEEALRWIAHYGEEGEGRDYAHLVLKNAGRPIEYVPRALPPAADAVASGREGGHDGR